MGLQAYALLAAAAGAVDAYEDVTGDAWKPYVRKPDNTERVDRQSADCQMAAFSA
jgi:hypothetical protein